MVTAGRFQHELQLATQKRGQVSAVLREGMGAASQVILDLPDTVSFLPPAPAGATGPTIRQRVLRAEVLGPILPHLLGSDGPPSDMPSAFLVDRTVHALVPFLLLHHATLPEEPRVRLARFFQGHPSFLTAPGPAWLDLHQAATSDALIEASELVPMEEPSTVMAATEILRDLSRTEEIAETARSSGYPVLYRSALGWVGRMVLDAYESHRFRAFRSASPNVMPMAKTQVKRFVEVVYRVSCVTDSRRPWELLHHVFLALATDSGLCRLHEDCRTHPDLGKACFDENILPRIQEGAAWQP